MRWCLLLCCLMGCALHSQMNAFLQSFFTDHQFTKDGFWIHAPRKKFYYNFRHNREVLKIKDDRLNEIVLIDQGCDGKVDEIRLNRKSRYFRGDDKSAPLFQRADQIFQEYRAMLYVEKFKEHWKKMTPLDIGGHNGLTGL